MSGSGTSDGLVNPGLVQVAPANSPGVLTIDGSMVTNNTASEIELAEATRC